MDSTALTKLMLCDSEDWISYLKLIAIHNSPSDNKVTELDVTD